MGFMGGLLITRKGHDYMSMVVDMFNKMCVLMPCKNTISGKEATNLFFRQVWVHFWIPMNIIPDNDMNFSMHFGIYCGRI